jgi:hypothetical protein
MIRDLLVGVLERAAVSLDGSGDKEAADACAVAAVKLAALPASKVPSFEAPQAPLACLFYKPSERYPGRCKTCSWPIEPHEKRGIGSHRPQTVFERLHDSICIENPCPWHGERSERIARRKGN